jgi:hypothetical protein
MTLTERYSRKYSLNLQAVVCLLLGLKWHSDEQPATFRSMMQLLTFVKVQGGQKLHNITLGDNVLPHPSALEGLAVAT